MTDKKIQEQTPKRQKPRPTSGKAVAALGAGVPAALTGKSLKGGR